MKSSFKAIAVSAALLVATAVPALSQGSVRRAMQRAKEQAEAQARTREAAENPQVLSPYGGYLSFTVENGDTTYFDRLDPIWIFGRSKHSEKDWKKYYKLVYNFARVYPYALASGRLQEIVDSTIAAGNYGAMKRDRYINKVQADLFRDFEGALRKMTISQGRVLLKLIDRETGKSSYSIIKEYKNGAAAGFWNGIAKIFDNDLRSQYDPEGADRNLEELVQMWHSGIFPNFYYSIFFEDPPEVHVPDTYK